MNQILDYIEVMFKALPASEEARVLKRNITESMELKYKQYREEGKTDSESIGLVIGEFGSIDELKEVLDIQETEELQLIDGYRVDEYLRFVPVFSRRIALGIALLILSLSFVDVHEIIGIGVFFLAVLISVGLFISNGFKYSGYSDITNNPHLVSNSDKVEIRKIIKDGESRCIKGIVAGVMLCIIGVVAGWLLGESNLDSLVQLGMFLPAAIGVYLFVSIGTPRNLLNHLVEVKSIDEDKRMNDIEGSFMGLGAIGYVAVGLIWGWWHIAWIIFPVIALLFELIKAIQGGKHDH